MASERNYQRVLSLYIAGFGISLVLTLIPFALVVWAGWSLSTTLILIGVCAITQILVHFRFFLHIDFSKKKREDLYLLLFSLALLILMAGGTIWIMWSLAMRMM